MKNEHAWEIRLSDAEYQAVRTVTLVAARAGHPVADWLLIWVAGAAQSGRRAGVPAEMLAYVDSIVELAMKNRDDYIQKLGAAKYDINLQTARMHAESLRILCDRIREITQGTQGGTQ